MSWVLMYFFQEQTYLCHHCGEELQTQSDLQFHELFHDLDEMDYSGQEPWSPIALGPTPTLQNEPMEVDDIQ